MSQLRLQQSLFVDASSHIQTLHGQSKKSRIYMAQNERTLAHPKPIWNQSGYTYNAAMEKAWALSVVDAIDCYVSANGFNWEKLAGRSVSSVESLNGFYVDFDKYKVEQYRDLSSDQFLDAVLTDNPWLPVPTAFEDSGNGCWMFWQFLRPLHLPSKNTWLEQWQTYQDYLIRKLLRYGADPACADASRVVRLAGTINSKTSREAKAWATSDRYEFAVLKKALLQEYQKDKALAEPRKQQRHSHKPSDRSVVKVLNLHTLAYARMSDLKSLARLRGGQFTDGRRMATWLYSVEAAHFCRSEDSLRTEVEEFVREYISQPEQYLKAVNYESTIDRFNNEMRLVEAGATRQQAREQLGRKASRYTLSNAYIIGVLGIDPAEQRKLSTLIGTDEKRRRHVLGEQRRRRNAGAVPRADYLARIQTLRQQARELHQAGQSVRAIAKQMAVPLSSVHRYLHG